jgi:hypothetical protein
VWCLNFLTPCQLFQDLATKPELVMVFFGANDAAVPVPSGKGQAVPIEEFKKNLIKIASHLKVEFLQRLFSGAALFHSFLSLSLSFCGGDSVCCWLQTFLLNKFSVI